MNTNVSKLRNRVVQVKRFGAPDGLEVVDAPLPTAGKGQVRVRVLASSLNYTDTLIRRHMYPQTAAERLPFVLGYDVIGEIDQLGAGVTGFAPGECVADMTVIGSNAAYCTLKADHLARVPAGLDPAEAATVILSWTTAHQLLHRVARVRRGQRVLVQGAAGAVGQALLALGKLAGIEMWGTARGEHVALIRGFGATPIDYQREDFTRVLPGGFDVVIDGVGEDGYRRSFAALKRGGLLCAIGYSAGVQARRSMLAILTQIARLYLWRWSPAASGPAFTQSILCGRGIPHGSRWIWSGCLRCWERARSIRASRSGFRSARLPRLTVALKRADLRVSLSCARTHRREATA